MKKIILMILVMLILCSSAFALTTQNLESYWSFDNADIIGSTLYESHFKIWNANNTNALANQTTSIHGQSFYYDGNGDYTLSSMRINYSDGQAFTWNVWVYRTINTNYLSAMACKDASKHIWMRTELTTWETELLLDDDTGVYELDGNATNINVWYMVTWTFDGTNKWMLYLNGTNVMNFTQATAAFNINSTVIWGCEATVCTYDFKGYIDEASTWKRMLTPADVTELMTTFYENMTVLVPVILNSSYNFTSASSNENSTAWRNGNESTPIKTIDSTPTVTFNTVNRAYCRINKVTMNWTAMGDSRNCTTTGALNHVCTLADADKLEDGLRYQQLVVACADAGTLSSMNVSYPLNMSYVYSSVSGGIFNTSWVNVTSGNISEGQEFNVWANLSWLANGTSLTNETANCSFSMLNASVEYYSNTGSNATLCLGGSCTYTNKSNWWTADTSVFNTDVYRFRLCRRSAATPDAYYTVVCAGGAGTSGNIVASTVPLCAAGYKNVTVMSAGCVSAASLVNISLWTTGNTLAKGYTLLDDSGTPGVGFPGFDRYRNEVNTQMVWNATMNLWHSYLHYEYYMYGTKVVNVSCSDTGGTTQNASISFYVVSPSPSVLFNFVEDWLTGTVDFTNLITMRYPLIGSINTSVLCQDEHLSVIQFGINLTFENGTYIYGHTGTGSPGTLSWSASNFSTDNNYLDGLIGYDLDVVCINTLNLSTFSSRRFYATNAVPTSGWSNVSGGIYDYQPTLGYVCVDTEGEDMTGYVVWNGTTIATNTPVPNGSAVNFNTAGFGVGTWTIGIICEDSFRNSTNTTITWTYDVNCIPAHSGLDDARYQNDVVEVCLGCSNGINISGAWFRINDFDLHHVMSNLSECWNMTLERGWNRINLTVEGNGLNVSSYYNVWAKSMNSSIFDYPVIWFMIIIGFVVMLFGMYLKVPLFMSVSGLMVALVGYELLNISMFFGGLTIISGILLMLYLGFKGK